MQNIIENYEGDANDGVLYTILLKMIENEKVWFAFAGLGDDLVENDRIL